MNVSLSAFLHSKLTYYFALSLFRTACTCNLSGSLTNVCDTQTGTCSCKVCDVKPWIVCHGHK